MCQARRLRASPVKLQGGWTAAAGFMTSSFFVLSTGSLQERSAILQVDRSFTAETVLRDRQSRPAGLA